VGAAEVKVLHSLSVHHSLRANLTARRVLGQPVGFG
jgi:hypothetical protein